MRRGLRKGARYSAQPDEYDKGHDGVGEAGGRGQEGEQHHTASYVAANTSGLQE